MCDIVFEKARGRGRKVNRASVDAEAVARRALSKFAGTPFLQNSSGRLLLIMAVSIVAKGVLVN